MTDHVHQLVYVGQLKGEHGGSYPCRHCRECGTLVMFSGSSTFEMVPRMFRTVASAAPQVFVSGRQRGPRRALGRGLLDLMATLPTSGKRID